MSSQERQDQVTTDKMAKSIYSPTQYVRTINEGRSRKEFKSKLKKMNENGFFKASPKEKIENGFGYYGCHNRSLLVVRYRNFEPEEANLFSTQGKDDKETSKLLELIGML